MVLDSHSCFKSMIKIKKLPDYPAPASAGASWLESGQRRTALARYASNLLVTPCRNTYSL